jgi:hypothetical protein
MPVVTVACSADTCGPHNVARGPRPHTGRLAPAPAAATPRGS